MKKGKHDKKSNKAVKFAFIMLMLLVSAGFVNQEQFLYQYNLSKIKSSITINEKIEFSKKAIRHSKSLEDVMRVKELLKLSI